MKKLERILKALANERRLKILKLLKRDGETPVGEIAERIGLSFKATSKHLAILRQADLVDSRQVRLTVYYSIDQDLPPAGKSIINLL
ncbi:metalloregulator ArsR/SmtB family transcription factor [Patescibacteria group bacterium]|nr:metalloregulator ArsR/SmtB family transcription factor [Patescibacteria group bacterium]MBU1906637.1 metalloregulator ArsR/SmtB family transcription factor [Patescibacteria group bacterium]